jgi:hypothetical protein
MIGVLMASARPGQRRPGLTDSANLLWGALRIRLRTALGGESAPVWRDALAAVTVIVPLFLLLKAVTQLAIRLFEAGLASPDQILAQHPHGLIVPATTGWYLPPSPATSGAMLLLRQLVAIAPLLLLAALVLLRLRRAAMVTAAVLLVYLPVVTVAASFGHSYVAPADTMVLSMVALFTALALEVAALRVSPGPGRGLEILTWKGLAVLAAAAVAMGTAASAGWWLPTVAHPPLGVAPLLAAGAIVTIGMAWFSALSRRVLIALAVPGCYLLLGPLVPWMGPVEAALAYLPLLIAVAAIAVARSRRTSPPAGEQT